jgi:hypothetical protein
MSSFPHASGNLGLAVSLDATGVVGNVYDAVRISGGSIQILTVGTAEGTFALQGSNVIRKDGPVDYTDDNANWATVDQSAVTAGGTCLLNLEDFGFRFLRLFFTNTSGTGTGDFHFCFKGHG